MERTRVAKVDNVTLARRGEQVVGNLHLTPHHLIFSHIPSDAPPAQSEQAAQSASQGAVTGTGTGTPVRPRELWITYPIICLCTLRPAPAVSRQLSSIRLRCRDFTFVCFYFTNEAKAREVYDAIRQWTCKLGRIDKLYAFAYQPPLPEREFNGWDLYDPRKEYARQGVDEGCGWRISQINSDYGFSPTYPAVLAVPTTISDNTLNYAGRYRSRARVPILTYRHPVNNCSITRSSQPLVGVRQNRSIQDEKLLASIFSTSRSERPLANVQPSLMESESFNSTQSDGPPGQQNESEFGNAEELEDEMLASVGEDVEDGPRIYGAQQQNLIVDARPTVNAFAMQAVGLGSENMDNYKFATKAYLGIDNIHVMRDSLNKVVDALKESDVTPLGPNRDQLARSGWLKHIGGILDGGGLIARQVGLQHSHVLIHCSDGWDRTSQLSALSQVCLDPYYRTLEGFMVLVEKDWLSFGHMFRHRSGHLNSEKWFQIDNERIGGDANREGSGAGKALENAFLSAKGFFNRDNTSRDSLPESEGDTPPNDSETPGAKKPSPSPRSVLSEKEVTKVKETSPVFHQFLDATYQLLYQHPTRFEFNERFLRRLLYHLYSCQFGTFLFNSEKERMETNARDRTRSVWDYFLARREQFTNPQYDPQIDDNKRGKERLIFPRLSEVRWWNEAFGRTDAEMNGPRTSGPVVLPPANETVTPAGSRSPVITGIETAHHSVGTGVAGQDTAPSAGTAASSTGLAALATGISSLSLPTQPAHNKENQEGSEKMDAMEVEMQ